MDSGRDAQSSAGPPLGHALKLFLQETSAFKQQNPGKFCLLVCSLCTFSAVVGRYIPGIALTYLLVLGVFLWPLFSSHDVASWLERVLQKLDFGIGEFLQKIKENHEKRMLKIEREGVDSDQSSIFPQDSALCQDMSVSDTEVSDGTWTFNLSEGNTPQTENSEDLDREEVFSGGLPEFPSLDNSTPTNGDDDDDDNNLSLVFPAPQPMGSKRTPAPLKDQPTDTALQSLDRMAGDFITAAVTAAIQERIEAAVGLPGLGGAQERSRFRETGRLLDQAEESDSEVEDFELLDQSELEQLERELGLGEKTSQVQEEAVAKTQESSGFFTKLLRRH